MALESVQAVASLVQNNSIPAEFIRSESEQPAKTTYKDAVAEIPTIDISDADEDKVVRLMSDASREWGIFQIINHGIPDDVIAKLQSVGKEFFELPHDEKMKCGKEPGSNSYEGYGTKLQKEVEGRKSWVDHLFHIVWPPSAINFRFWPSNPPAYREANEEYAKYMREVVEKLFGGLSKGLGLVPHKLKEGAGGDEAVFMMKINYYPPCPRPDLTLGVVAHTDLSALTILVPNQVPGLQVFKDERWVDVKYIPNALIVHIGDQIQVSLSSLFSKHC